MAYEPTQWRSGDTITSERLNKMEQGIAGGGSGEFYTLHVTGAYSTEEGKTVYTNVELTENKTPICLILNLTNDGEPDPMTYRYWLSVERDEYYGYGCFESPSLYVRKSTGEVADSNDTWINPNPDA